MLDFYKKFGFIDYGEKFDNAGTELKMIKCEFS